MTMYDLRKMKETIEMFDEQWEVKQKYIECLELKISALEDENKQFRKFCEEFNALDVAKENQQLKDLLKECRDGLEKIKHIGETKKLGAIYQVAERTLAKTDEALK